MIDKIFFINAIFSFKNKVFIMYIIFIIKLLKK